MAQYQANESSSIAKIAYTVPWVNDLVAEITEFLRDNVEWLGIPPATAGRRMLDYACGNGAASRVSDAKKPAGFLLAPSSWEERRPPVRRPRDAG